MKAVCIRAFGAPHTHRVEVLPDLVAGPEEVLIEVHAAAVNYPDLLVVSGKYQILPPLPFAPGKDAAGIVRALGPGIKGGRLQVGDRVVAQLESGGYASLARAPQDWVHPIPASLSMVAASAIDLVYQTAYFALTERGQFQAGETVFVTGAAGGVGLAAVQIAKALGARVLAGVNREDHAQLVRAQGADAVIDLAQPNLRDAIRAQVHALTQGRGVDLVLDTLGGDVFDGALRALAWCGRLVVIGFAAGRIPELKANYLLVKNIAVSGLQWSDYRERSPARVAQVQQALFALYEQGAIRPLVSQTLPLESFAEAMETLAAGQATGKIVLTVAP